MTQQPLPPDPEAPQDDTRSASIDQRAGRVVATAFALSMTAGLCLLALYILGGQTQLEGILLAIVLAGIGVGLVVWSHRLMPVPQQVEERHPLSSDAASRAGLVEALSSDGDVGRRRFLLRLLAGALASLAAALAMPVLSLGPAPGRSLFRTAWRGGLHLVGLDGKPIRSDSLPLGSITTVFPEGAVGAADAQTVLLRVDPAKLQLEGEAANWAPEGFVAYSKVCTHAGCPVGLYQQETNELICPCHQSTFDVLRGALPTSGPAVRPLPQLPIRLEADGTFTALSDFPEPVGPSFWDIHG